MSRATCSKLTQKIRFLLLFVVLSGGLILSGCAGVMSASGNAKDNGASAAPSITSQPVSASVTVGQTATFFVATTGTTPLSYQWQKNNTAIAGGTSSTYTTLPTTASDNRALFRVVVSNNTGSATSNAATLNVAGAAIGAPSITTQPVSAGVTVGQTATFSVAVTGTAPLSFKWQKNGAAVSGATSSTYTTPPTTASDNRALFTVVVSNSAGSVTSNSATLNVSGTAGVAVQVNPTSATVSVGSTQQFALTVTGTSNTAVTWTVSGAGCSGAACGTISAGGLYTSPASVPSPATVSVTVTSVADPTKSASASISLVAATAVLLSISPTSASVPAASTDSFTATVTGTSITAVSWSLNGAGCSGSSCGTVASSSLAAVYTAPRVAPSPASVNVVATSMADPSKTASATVTIMSVVVVTVTPASTSLVTGTTQPFNASVVGTPNTAVTWTVQGTGCSGAACGTINGAGLYTAPSTIPSPAGVTVTAASSADPSKRSSSSVTIVASTATNANGGLNIPASHPKLFWTPSRISTAQAWVTNTKYPGLSTSPRPLDDYDVAFTCLVMNVSAACTQAITDATGFAPTCSSGVGCDGMRASGEQMLLIRDWLAPGCGKASCLTSAQVAAIDGNWSTWQANQDSPAQTWGNVGMPASNYFAGQFRNDFDFGVVANGENAAAATNLSYALTARWPDLQNFGSPTGTGKNGTLGYGLHSQEGGGEYGRYSLNYYALAMSSAAVMGRDLWNETTAFQSGVLQTIYNTMLTPTTSRGMWDMFTWADDENWEAANGCGYVSHNATGNANTTGGCGAESQYYGDFMQSAATEYSATNVGKYARQWLATVQPAVGTLFRSVDTGGSALAFSNLPLDYYSSGAQYMYAHDAWATTGTTVLWQMGLNQGANPSTTSALGTGHYHQDAGTFQASRKGVNIIRETPTYGVTVAGYGGVGTVDGAIGFAHNIPLIGGQAAVNLFGACADGPGVVKRLETQPGYAFAVTDLTLTYQNNVCDSGHPERKNPFAVTVVREYYYFRGINVLVILDRLQTDTAARSTTFVSHCEKNPVVTGATVGCIDGAQEAFYTALVPSAPTINVVAENANSATAPNWQYRIEANNTNPGNVVSYNIYTIQLGDAAGFNPLKPSIVDSASGTPGSGTFTITIDANDSLVVNKGIASTGGTIKAAGTATTLSSIVHGMAITSSGPVWQ
jgi:Immunoglobulin I-set domain